MEQNNRKTRIPNRSEKTIEMGLVHHIAPIWRSKRDRQRKNGDINGTVSDGFLQYWNGCFDIFSGQKIRKYVERVLFNDVCIDDFQHRITV